MTVIEKNSGTKIPYEVVKNKICFDDDLTINLAKREDDRDVHIDVCYDSYGEQLCGRNRYPCPSVHPAGAH